MDIEFSGSHRRAQYFHSVFVAYRPTLRGLANRALFAVAVASLYLVYQLNLSPDRSLPFLAPSRLGWHILALTVFVFLLAEPFLAPVYVAFRLWRDPSIHIEWKGVVNGEGIAFSSSGRTIRWNAFREVIPDGKEIILKTGPSGFLSLPRDFFHSDSDWQRFRKLAETKIRANVPLGKKPNFRK